MPSSIAAVAQPKSTSPTCSTLQRDAPHGGPDVNGPLPSGLVRGAADGHASDANEFEFSFFERSYLVGLFKTLQNCLKHGDSPLASRICGNPLDYSSSSLAGGRAFRFLPLGLGFEAAGLFGFFFTAKRADFDF